MSEAGVAPVPAAGVGVPTGAAGGGTDGGGDTEHMWTHIAVSVSARERGPRCTAQIQRVASPTSLALPSLTKTQLERLWAVSSQSSGRGPGRAARQTSRKKTLFGPGFSTQAHTAAHQGQEAPLFAVCLGHPLRLYLLPHSRPRLRLR